MCSMIMSHRFTDLKGFILYGGINGIKSPPANATKIRKFVY